MKRLMRTISDDWIEEEEPQEEQPQGVNKEPLVEQQREHQEHRADKQQGDLEEPRELRKPGELKKRKLKQAGVHLLVVHSKHTVSNIHTLFFTRSDILHFDFVC